MQSTAPLPTLRRHCERALLFHRGVGVIRMKGLFIAQKIDLLVTYLVAQPTKKVRCPPQHHSHITSSSRYAVRDASECCAVMLIARASCMHLSPTTAPDRPLACLQLFYWLAPRLWAGARQKAEQLKAKDSVREMNPNELAQDAELDAGKPQHPAAQVPCCAALRCAVLHD